MWKPKSNVRPRGSTLVYVLDSLFSDVRSFVTVEGSSYVVPSTHFELLVSLPTGLSSGVDTPSKYMSFTHSLKLYYWSVLSSPYHLLRRYYLRLSSNCSTDNKILFTCFFCLSWTFLYYQDIERSSFVYFILFLFKNPWSQSIVNNKSLYCLCIQIFIYGILFVVFVVSKDDLLHVVTQSV